MREKVLLSSLSQIACRYASATAATINNLEIEVEALKAKKYGAETFAFLVERIISSHSSNAEDGMYFIVAGKGGKEKYSYAVELLDSEQLRNKEIAISRMAEVKSTGCGKCGHKALIVGNTNGLKVSCDAAEFVDTRYYLCLHCGTGEKLSEEVVE